MKTINIKDYNPSMGLLIDVRNKDDYIKSHVNGSINIPYNELIFNHSKYLNKSNKYFIICLNGIMSRKAVNILHVYGYNVINVVR